MRRRAAGVAGRVGDAVLCQFAAGRVPLCAAVRMVVAGAAAPSCIWPVCWRPCTFRHAAAHAAPVRSRPLCARCQIVCENRCVGRGLV